MWDYAGLNSFGEGRLKELETHPTIKPLAMIKDALLDCSNRRGLVLDPFAGNGTILLAAEQTNRRAYAMELDPHYLDVCIRRWQKATGESAVLVETSQSFSSIEAIWKGADRGA